ncbi:polyketide cyclase [Marinomonas primoryensis]|uniref:Polyketide cyclase n=1 Tax=Marinomonas primoryensis TaxID=178399 RepID=A0A2Z4PVK4_9GAMM|nr:nuclear transport factor 2 family protein [Marinomonas primoryensis]AWY01601.1 polyketide cyclase [Marinomonas primoryensis]
MKEQKTTELGHLLERIDALESEQAVRVCINRYMDLCDHLSPATSLDELGDLFTEDAIWEGKGARYSKSFGGYQSRHAIVSMLAKYTVEPTHFALNVHYLSSEVIQVHGDEAKGSWNMIQVSTFSAGGSHLNSARLSVAFRRDEGRWRISHFETENRFSRPVSNWNDTAALPVPK